MRTEVTDQIVAKVVAGMNRVRIRKDARFFGAGAGCAVEPRDRVAQLDRAQRRPASAVRFLVAGGTTPSTITQEGLAVFYEVYGHTMSQRRFLWL